jgi:hypothetical protein
MFTTPPRQETHPRMAARNTRTRRRRLAAVLAALISGLLAFAANAPAALAMIGPGPGGSAGVAPVPAITVRVVATGGMAAWQITLIALGAALFTATAAVLLYRALAARTAASAATAYTDGEREGAHRTTSLPQASAGRREPEPAQRT